MRAIVLTFDRLPVHWLSCFGNEWIETPAFDRLAAQSAVFDQHFAEIPASAGPSHPWWTGRFEFFRPGRSAPQALELLRAAKVSRHLIAESLEGLPLELFDTTEAVEGSDGLSAEHDQVPFARLVTRASAWLQDATRSESSVLWLHSRGVPSPWCPPQFFAELYLDELTDSDSTDDDDDEGGLNDEMEIAVRAMLEQLSVESDLRDVVLSERLFATSEDDGEALSLPLGDDGLLTVLHELSRLLFAGYVTLLDHWLGRFMESLPASSEETLFIVTAATGQAFGERTPLLPATLKDDADSDVIDMLLWTPLFVRSGPARDFGTRHRDLVQPVDVAATLLDWFHVSAPEAGVLDGVSLLSVIDGSASNPHEVALHFGNAGEVGIRDANFALRGLRADEVPETFVPDANADVPGKLFARPDDPHQVNEIGAQQTEEQLRLLVRLWQEL